MSDTFVTHNIDDLQRALALLPVEVTQRVMRQVADTAEREMLRRYRRTTDSWEHKPAFETVKEVTPTSIAVMVGTDDRVYGFVDKGTRPHDIEPKGPGYPLRFQVGYSAKTLPGFLGSRKGGKFGPERRAMKVHHPGTEARGFSEMIYREIGPMVFDQTNKLIVKEMHRHWRVWGSK